MNTEAIIKLTHTPYEQNKNKINKHNAYNIQIV